MSNSQFTAIVGIAVALLIGMMLFDRYSARQEKGGSLVLVRRFLECKTEPGLAKP